MLLFGYGVGPSRESRFQAVSALVGGSRRFNSQSALEWYRYSIPTRTVAAICRDDRHVPGRSLRCPLEVQAVFWFRQVAQVQAGLLHAVLLRHSCPRADMSKVSRRVVARDLGVSAGSSHKSNLKITCSVCICG